MYDDNKLLRFRKQKDDAWKHAASSPLTEEQEQFQYYLFFRDQTTGKETYENGRMLQIPKKALPAGRQVFEPI